VRFPICQKEKPIMLVLARTHIAMKILHHLATCPGGVATKYDISKSISVTVPYVGKISLQLLRAGFVKSIRGPRGGYTLALPAAAIRVGDVAQFIDDTRCWRSQSELEDAGMNTALKKAQDKFFDVLNTRSIADLCDPSKGESDLKYRTFDIAGKASSAPKSIHQNCCFSGSV